MVVFEPISKGTWVCREMPLRGLGGQDRMSCCRVLYVS